MPFLRRFGDFIKNSIYAPEAYREVRELTFGRAVAHASVAAAFPTIAGVVVALLSLFTIFSINIAEEVARVYPDDLEITLTQGVVHTNVQEPYVIPIPEKWRGMQNTTDAGTSPLMNLVVIDTRENLTVDEVHAHNALFVVGRTRIYAKESDQKLETFDMSDPALTATITEASALAFVHEALPYLYALGVLLFTVVLGFVYAFFVVTYLLYAVGGALIVMVIGLIVRNPHSFAEAFMVATYALIPVAFVQMGIDLFALNTFGIGLAMFFVIIFVNLRNQLTTPTTTEPADV